MAEKLSLVDFFKYREGVNEEQAAEDLKNEVQEPNEENIELQASEVEAMQSILNEKEF